MRTALASAFLSLLAACASTGTSRPDGDGAGIPDATSIDTAGLDLVLSDPAHAGNGDTASAVAPSHSAGDPAIPTGATSLDASSLEPVPVHLTTNALPRLGDDGIGESYTMLRLGAFDPAGDVSALDTGYWAEVAFGKRFAKLFSVEAATGFYNLTGTSGAEVYGVPLLINGRVGVPIAIVEPYAGFGVGGLWAHAETNGLSGSDSFAGLWNAFLGVEVGLAGFALGAEYKYLQSGDLDGPGGLADFQLEGHVFFLTGKLPF